MDNNTTTNKSKGNKNSLSRQAMQFLSAQRVQGGYTLYDNYTGRILATLTVVDGANDIINTRLRDEVISIYYEYGKVLGYYR